MFPALALPAYAVQSGTLGTTVNLSSGASNRVQNPSVAAPAGNSFSTGFYALYPSLSLNSMRPTSSLTATYGFGYNRTVSSSAQPTASHTGSLTFSSQFSPRWSAKLSDSFRMTDGLGTFGALSGAPQLDSSSIYSFQSVGGRRLPRTNDMAAGLDWALDQNSSLSFSAKHSFRTYRGSAAAGTLVSDQQQLTGSISFQQKLGITEGWGLTWNATYSDYGRIQAISQAAEADYTVGIGGNFTTQIGAGVSRTNIQGTSTGKLNYDALFGLARNTTSQTFALTYTQNSTDRVGLGSTALTRRASLNWNRPIGKATASARISAYKSQGTLSNAINVRGITADVNLGYQLTTRWSVSGGGNYRTTGTGAFGFTQKRVFYSGSTSFSLTKTLFISGGGTFDNSTQTSQFDFTQKRVYLSLRYTEPNLIRFR